MKVSKKETLAVLDLLEQKITFGEVKVKELVEGCVVANGYKGRRFLYLEYKEKTDE
jgi:hypothetical protein